VRERVEKKEKEKERKRKKMRREEMVVGMVE
jgi:hypothetical protein